MSSSGVIRVLLADDHEIVREGLQMFLTEEEGIHVVGQARDGEAAVRLAKELRPDVILMDLVMPRVDGIEATKRLRADASLANCQVVILTSFADDTRVREALKAGAIAYLMKDVLKADLLAAIRSAAQGKPTLHPEAQQYLIRHVAEPGLSASSPLGSLTDRERDVLTLIARGNSNKEIAAKLTLTVGTVKGYVSAILVKIGVADRTQATLAAIKYGLVTDVTVPDSRY